MHRFRFANVSVGYVVVAGIFFGTSACATRPAERTGPQYAVRATPESRAITEATGETWVISTQGRAATDAAAGVLRGGGNLIDAAVAASFAISVERPHSTGIGGGGFMLYREAKTGKVHAIDFRERAPARAREKMYLDAKGEGIPERSRVGIHAAGVPGLVKGLADLHRRFGRKPWRELLSPAIALAENGLEVYPVLAMALEDQRDFLGKYSSSKTIFLKADGSPYRLGEKIRQRELARSLREIAAGGSEAFYGRRIGKAIVAAADGWIDAADLRGYRTRWLKPLRSNVGPYEVIAMPPPSSGGIHLIQILNLLEHDPLRKLGFQSPEALHLIASAMQRAFVDRARYLGDPDWVKMPIKTLTSKAYAAGLRREFRSDRAATADELDRQMPVLPEHTETTHFSMMDREGNIVVSTQTINGWFGSKFVVPETGILLNNEMDDFSTKPGASNLYGAIGSKANSVQPGKTPLSSMSPTIVLEGGRPRLALGAPGGTQIITCVAQTVLNALVYELPLYEAINAIRIHQQWRPDTLRIEAPGLATATEADLTARGWRLDRERSDCALMAVAREGEVLHGVSEPRDHGKAAAD